MNEDVRLKSDVLAELAWEPSVSATHIGVSARDGTVTLTGHVDSFRQKSAAAAAAGRVSGLRALVEDIAVRLPAGARREDAAITAAVQDRLTWDSAIPAGAVGVTVADGVVTLTGALDHGWLRDAAADHVRPLTGVTGLVNRITVMARPVPAHLGKDIRMALNRTTLRDENIEAHVTAGAVHLTGSVPTWHDKGLASAIAWAAPGTASVSNDIRVG